MIVWVVIASPTPNQPFVLVTSSPVLFRFARPTEDHRTLFGEGKIETDCYSRDKPATCVDLMFLHT
ncbi:hypothetical protein Hanom_Chr04g00332711 [Helianthus anomalus]